jgi:hypothetical protein
MINLAQRDIVHSLGKFITTALGVGMLIGVVLIMIGVYRGMVHDASIVPNDIGVDLWVVQKDTLGPFAENSRLHEDLKYSLRGFAGVKEVQPLTFQSIQVPFNGQPIRTFALGFDVRSGYTPYHLYAGRDIHIPHKEIIVDTKTGLKLGDTLPLGREIYTIVGMTHKAVSSGGDPMIYLDLDEAQELQFLFSNEQIHNDAARGAKNSTATVNAFGLSSLTNPQCASKSNAGNTKKSHRLRTTRFSQNHRTFRQTNWLFIFYCLLCHHLTDHLYHDHRENERNSHTQTHRSTQHNHHQNDRATIGAFRGIGFYCRDDFCPS